jgi:hypothetical protein
MHLEPYIKELGIDFKEEQHEEQSATVTEIKNSIL